MSLTSSVETARSSLQATSDQISVVSRNIARVGDADATRKTATLVSGPGLGVSVPQISRTANELLFNAYLTANSDNQAQSTVSSALDQLQNTVDDTDLPSARRPLLWLASSPRFRLTRAIRKIPPSLPAWCRRRRTRRMRSILHPTPSPRCASRPIPRSPPPSSNINSLLSQFQDLNNQVVRGTGNGSDISDVLDSRDAVLKQLSSEVGIRTITRDNGDMAIYTDSGVTLFDKAPRQVTFQQTSEPRRGRERRRGLRRRRSDCGNAACHGDPVRQARRIGFGSRRRHRHISKPARRNGARTDQSVRRDRSVGNADVAGRGGPLHVFRRASNSGRGQRGQRDGRLDQGQSQC